jgi:beta-phosphoglucomutase
MVRAVVFDFDGVLANSEPLHFRAFRDVLAHEGVELSEPEYYERYLGFNDAAAYEAVAADRGRRWDASKIASLIERKAVVLEALERGESILFPGARAVVERLAAQCPLAIASGARGDEIRRILERERLTGHFTTIVSSDDAPVSKPAPDSYLLAVARLNEASGSGPLAARECVAIEDSPWGLASARAAGLRTVAVTHTYPAGELPDAEIVVDRLDSLTWAVLRNLSHASEGPDPAF